MATYVLIHGGGHGGWCYDKVTRLLKAAGHDVYAPSLTGCGDRAHLISDRVDLHLHITDVVSLLHSRDLRDVILVGHSYGGMVITGIADQAHTRVGKLVFLDAANPRNHQSLVDVSGPIIESTRPHGQMVDGVELVLIPTPGLGEFFGVTDPADIAWMDGRLTPHAWRCFEQKLDLQHEDALWAIPQFHIVCTSTIESRGAELIEKARTDGRLWDIDTGHDLMITEPQQVTAILQEIAAR